MNYSGFFQLLLRLPLLTIHMTDLFCVMSDLPSGTCFSNQYTCRQKEGKRGDLKCWKKKVSVIHYIGNIIAYYYKLFEVKIISFKYL